jgi:hypothetical protein
MVDEIADAHVGFRIVRPHTPPMKIPNHKIVFPSEAKSD